MHASVCGREYVETVVNSKHTGFAILVCNIGMLLIMYGASDFKSFSLLDWY